MKKLHLNIKGVVTLIASAGILALTSGCGTVIRQTPVAHPVINANMNASDYSVLGITEGKSTKTSVFFGLVQVIDGDKYRILGMRFFEDQYAYAAAEDRSWYEKLFGTVNTADRAYYKALAATPDADAVAAKAYLETDSGIPALWSSQEITYQGKAVKYKVHD